MRPLLYLKVDVDTDRGTRVGVPILQRILREYAAPACFLFSLGRDHTGRAIGRIFRRGFVAKVWRTDAVKIYGLRTLLQGTLLPGPHIGRRNQDIMRQIRRRGFETGIHADDHQRWQDGLARMNLAQIRAAFARAQSEYRRIFGEPARCAGAPGWQANAASRRVYDEAGLDYASDTRGTHPYWVQGEERPFRTLEIPTTLPTLDELLGRPEFPENNVAEFYLSQLQRDRPNVLTIHAEIEGMAKTHLFVALLHAVRRAGIEIAPLHELAARCRAAPESVPVHRLCFGAVAGRSGVVARQSEPVAPGPPAGDALKDPVKNDF